MGVAMEWFDEAQRRDIAVSLLSDVDEKGGRGGKLWAACPFHREGSVGGSFFYEPEKDHAYCFSCRASEDLLGLFCAVAGYPQNSADGFRAFKERFAAGRELPARAAKPAEAAPRQAPAWEPRDEEMPHPLWSQQAEAFVVRCAERLAATPSVLAQLAAWGIDPDTAAKCRIGFNDRDRYVKRADWGLPEELKADGTPKKLWLPEGLVLPFYVGGLAARLKVRRAHPERGPEMVRNLRYYHVPGGGKRMYLYGRPRCRAWVVVETERDAAMIWGKVRDLGVGAVGTGSASNHPDAAAHAILSRADIILVALDFDHAGRAAWDWSLRQTKDGQPPRPAWCWSEAYPLAVRWPSPPEFGKDVGDAVGQAGFDVRAWVEAGLPAHVRLRLAADLRRRQSATTSPPPAQGQDAHRQADPQAVTASQTAQPRSGYPEDIPGLDFSDQELSMRWDETPPDYPGRAAYFSLLGLLSSYPAGGGRVREEGDGPERDGVVLRMDEGWRRANPSLARRIGELFWGEAHDLWLAWDWPDAPVVVRPCGGR